MVADNGILYACGDSRYGKLCINNKSENVTKPTKILFSVSNLKVEKVDTENGLNFQFYIISKACIASSQCVTS